MMPAGLEDIRTALPPIVLLVDRHRDELEAFSRCLEDAGLWVATTGLADEAVAAAEELRPDIIVAEAEPPQALAAVDALKEHPELGDVPVIVMTSAPQARVHADSVLIKPVEPALLLRRTTELLARAGRVRASSDEILKRGERLREHSSALLNHVAHLSGSQRSHARMCPQCEGSLEWVEQGTIGGTTYDYYRWCLNGCGLYCFDRDRSKWVKLA